MIDHLARTDLTVELNTFVFRNFDINKRAVNGLSSPDNRTRSVDKLGGAGWIRTNVCTHTVAYVRCSAAELPPQIWSVGMDFNHRPLSSAHRTMLFH